MTSRATNPRWRRAENIDVFAALIAGAAAEARPGEVTLREIARGARMLCREDSAAEWLPGDLAATRRSYLTRPETRVRQQ